MNYEFEFESYDIDISHIKDNDTVCWQYTKNAPIEEGDWYENNDVYYKLSPVT